jgi:predicted dehydrogenase
MGQRACFHGGCMFRDCKDIAVLAAICDNRQDRLDYAKNFYQSEFGNEITGYLDYRDMCAKAKLDAVFVCGPTDLHRDMTIDAFKAGLHVLCEKPMELTLARCDEMIAASQKYNKILGMGMQMHYRKRYIKVQELIRKGEIGAPTMLWCTEYRNPFIEMKDWVWDKKRSGGAIVEKNCHHYDIMSMFVESDPTTVYASGGQMKHAEIHGRKSEIIDNAWIVNDYASGARGMVGICFMSVQEHYREFGVIGTEGSIKFSTSDKEIIHMTNCKGERFDIEVPGEVRGDLFRDFITCVRDGGAPFMTAEMARASMLIPLAAEKSIDEKRIVHVNELK